MAAAGLPPNISVKLIIVGLDEGDEVARAVAGFVRVNMERSADTARAVALFEALHDEFPEQVGLGEHPAHAFPLLRQVVAR